MQSRYSGRVGEKVPWAVSPLDWVDAGLLDPAASLARLHRSPRASVVADTRGHNPTSARIGWHSQDHGSSRSPESAGTWS